MKKLFLITTFFAMLFAFVPQKSEAALAKNIYAITDSGNVIYMVKTSTNDTPALAHKLTIRIMKTGVEIQTQNNYLYIKTSFGVIYPILYGTDSLTIAGIRPASLAAAASQLEYALNTSYLNYELHKVGTATTYRTVKSGYGTFGGFAIDSVGVGTGGSNATISIWDGTDSTGTLIGTWTTQTVGTIHFDKGTKFKKGLVVKPRGTTVGRFTILYYYMEPGFFPADWPDGVKPDNPDPDEDF